MLGFNPSSFLDTDKEKHVNQYEIQMLKNNNARVNDGRLSSQKFLKICESLKEVNETVGKQHGFSFVVPKNPEKQSDDMRITLFYLFGHKAIRLRKPFNFKTLMGALDIHNPDHFQDYLDVLLQKDRTVSAYIPEELRSVYMDGVPSTLLASQVGDIMTEYKNFCSRSTLPCQKYTI